MANSGRLTPQHLYSLPVVSDCEIDPTGTRVAYVASFADETSNSYHGSIRVLDLRDERVTMYTRAIAKDLSPRWSASGEQIFFLSDRDGSTQLRCIDCAGGEAFALPAVDGNISDFAVSPDGRHIAVVATSQSATREIERRGWRRITRLRYRADGQGYLDEASRLWIIDLFTGSVQVLTDGSGFVVSPAWSPDGSKLAFCAEHDPDADSLWHRELWVADGPSFGRLRKIAQLDAALEAPAWAPGGDRIAFIGLADQRGRAGLKNLRLYTVDADGSSLSCRSSNAEWTCYNCALTDTGVAGNIHPPVWKSDGEIAVLATDRGVSRVFTSKVNDEWQPQSPPNLSITRFSFGGNRLIACATDATTPPELYHLDAQRILKRLTHETDEWCTEAGLRKPVRRSVVCDGHAVDAWHLASSATTPRPCVLQIHGGPHFAYADAFFFEFQLLAAHGFDVLYCNPRGSQSYGEPFAAAIIGDWAQPAYLDCMRVLDDTLDREEIDRRRLAVAGGSYGGYLTAWTIGHTTRFAAAIAMRPATDLVSLWGTSEVGRMLDDELGGTPAQIPEVYRRCSPLTYADAIVTPLLMLHAENDYRCPTEQVEELFAALRARGQTAEVMRFLNADHGLSRTGPPRARVARLEAILEWFHRYLDHPQPGDGKAEEQKPQAGQAVAVKVRSASATSSRI